MRLPVSFVGIVLAIRPCVAADLFPVVESGRPAAVLRLMSPGDGPAVRAAQKDFALFNRHLKSVTGAGLPAEGALRGRIDVRLKTDLPIDRRFFWRITFPDARTMRVDATPHSLFTALRQILEVGADARFLGVENCMFQFEPRRDVRIPRAPLRSPVRSFTLLRNVFFLPGHARELGLSDDGVFKYSHGIPIYAFPGDLYNRDGWPSEIMPVHGGRRLERPDSLFNRWQPCYSNPRTAEIAAENILAFLRSHPSDKSVSLGVNDNGGYCGCAACKAMDAGGERSLFSNDSENHSASYYTFVNRVAKRVADEFPDVKIGLLAYIGTVMPPPFPLMTNVVPVVTMDAFGATLDTKVGECQRDVLRRWGEKAPMTGVWDYCWGRGYHFPRVDFAGQANRLKYLYENGCRAYFGENCVLADMVDGPKTYLTARLLEDIDADPEVILTEWYERFAGKVAAAELRGLYERCEAYWTSEAMRRSPVYVGRTFIYMYPGMTHLNALTPGLTADLVARARRVLALARTSGEKRRAQVLLCHFAYLDCLGSFGGQAYARPSSGEIESAEDAMAALDDLTGRMPELVREWEQAYAYFMSADFEKGNVYDRRHVLPLDRAELCARLFGQAWGYLGEKKVGRAFERLLAVRNLPDDMKWMLKAVQDGKGEETVVLTPGRVTGEDWRSRQDLTPGVWMTMARVRTPARGVKAEIKSWRQLDGKDRDWETFAGSPLEPDKWRTLVKVRRVGYEDDGLNVSLQTSGRPSGTPIEIAEVRLLRVSSEPDGRGGNYPADEINPRRGSKVEVVAEEKALVNRIPNAYDIAHIVVDVPLLRPDEAISVSIRAMRPAGARTGRIGAILFQKEKGGWTQFRNLLWNRDLSDRCYENIPLSVSAQDLGARRGRFLLIVYKMKGTDAVAVSRIETGFRGARPQR